MMLLPESVQNLPCQAIRTLVLIIRCKPLYFNVIAGPKRIMIVKAIVAVVVITFLVSITLNRHHKDIVCMYITNTGAHTQAYTRVCFCINVHT